MIVSHSRRFVFVKTRKTAGTSIEIALSQFAGSQDIITPISSRDEKIRQQLQGRGPQNLPIPSRRSWSIREWIDLLIGERRPEFYNHMPARRIRRVIGADRWKSYFTFAVERNPWDLAISAWYWERDVVGLQKDFTSFIFSRRIKKYSNWSLYTSRDGVIVDKIIAYHSLESGLRQVCERLELPSLNLPHAKAGLRDDRRPFQEWYDGPSQERIAEVFAKEISHFGWTFT